MTLSRFASFSNSFSSMVKPTMTNHAGTHEAISSPFPGSAIAALRYADPDVDTSMEGNLIKLQSLISQRQMAIGVTTEMLTALHDAMRTIIGNLAPSPPPPTASGAPEIGHPDPAPVAGETTPAQDESAGDGEAAEDGAELPAAEPGPNDVGVDAAANGADLLAPEAAPADAVADDPDNMPVAAVWDADAGDTPFSLDGIGSADEGIYDDVTVDAGVVARLFEAIADPGMPEAADLPEVIFGDDAFVNAGKVAIQIDVGALAAPAVDAPELLSMLPDATFWQFAS